jgi:Tol biopolymer transport system component
MPLASGSRLDKYEILEPIGAGGMGEVYRAKDSKLGRKVAIKILAPQLAKDPEALARFHREAQAVASLSHPNILAIHDFGEEKGVAYAIMELLTGESLRARLAGGALTTRQAVEFAVQICRGLAAADECGIVHRDLKPDNLFITRDSRIKILDFGLAKIAPPADESVKASGADDSPTASLITSPGMILGTASYMSPEQIRGLPADHRSDIFSFGVVFYEMLAGRKAFQADSVVEIMNAILKEEPPPLASLNRNIPSALERIVRRCMEKSPMERFHSARDLGFALEAVADGSGALPAPAAETAAVAAPAVPNFRRLTFRRGYLKSARFTPDGQSFVFGGVWDGNPVSLYTGRFDSPESTLLGQPETSLHAISATGEMAVSLGHEGGAGTLARQPLAGGAPRELLEKVNGADCSPDGRQYAVVRRSGDRDRLEYPIDTKLHETTGRIGSMRISPKGDRVAFIEHPMGGNPSGMVRTADLHGEVTTLSEGWASISGLAWTPDGELWFSAAPVGAAKDLYAVTADGTVRLLFRGPGDFNLEDIAKDGRMLLSHGSVRSGIIGMPPWDARERDLSWMDFSLVRGLSDDGRWLLLFEPGEGGGEHYSVYVRKLDGSAAIRLGDGSAQAFSPDGKWVLAVRHNPNQLLLHPAGAGKTRIISHPGMTYQNRGAWFQDGRRFVFAATEPDRAIRSYHQDLTGSAPRPLTPEGIVAVAVSPDDRFVAAGGLDKPHALYPVAGGEPRPIPGFEAGERPIRWSADGAHLYSYMPGKIPVKIYKTHLASGARETLKTLMPADPAGIWDLSAIYLTPDGKSHVFSYMRALQDLYLVEGLK